VRVGVFLVLATQRPARDFPPDPAVSRERPPSNRFCLKFRGQVENDNGPRHVGVQETGRGAHDVPGFLKDLLLTGLAYLRRGEPPQGRADPLPTWNGHDAEPWPA